MEPVPEPPIAVMLDELMRTARFSEAKVDVRRIKALRSKIDKALIADSFERARVYEEEAMRLLGYRKAWLACNSFLWMDPDLARKVR